MDYTQLIKKILLEDKSRLPHMNHAKGAASLIAILEEEINNFSYDKTDNLDYLVDIFDYLYDFIKDSNSLQIQFYDQFTSIHNSIRNLLHAKPKNLDTDNTNYQLLLKIIQKMENTMLRLDFDNPIEYDPNKEEFIYYITFKMHYINIFNRACERFPYIVNSVDQNGIPLVERVLTAYLNALEAYLSKENFGPIDDLIYYNGVLKSIMSNEKVKISSLNKKILLDKIKNFYDSHNYVFNNHKEKLSFFINDILSIINNEKENNSLDYLSYKYNVPTEFNEAHKLEAKRIYTQSTNIGRATTRKKIYTFDDIDAKEIDDGISLTLKDGIYHLGVHIADPGSYIPERSILFDEAKFRTTSLYMDNDSIPMYPNNLSSDIMSLNKGKNTYCMSFYFDIDSLTGELIHMDIKNEICRIEANHTYDYFNTCLDKGIDDQDFFNYLVNLSNLSEILKKVYNEDAMYQEFHSGKSRSLSENVIANAMIYTNYQVAKLFNDRELPFIYRCHEINEEDIKNLANLQDRLRQKERTDKIISNIEFIKSVYPRAYYSSLNRHHFGLGIDYYCHVTSPLRRLADNVAIMCIKKFILSPYGKDDIKRMNELTEETAEVINTKRACLEDYEIRYLSLKNNGKS